jgi:hypothetical protein
MAEDSPKAQISGGKSRTYHHHVEDNAIHLARKLRAFTVRRDASTRQT